MGGNNSTNCATGVKSAVLSARNTFRYGETVMTPQGPGTVESYRKADQMYVVLLDWRLANNTVVRTYLQVDQLKLLETPEAAARRAEKETAAAKTIVLPNGTRVDTFLGRGEITEYNPTTFDMSSNYSVCLDWTMDGGKHARAFLQPGMVKQVRKQGQLSDFVSTHFGTGVLQSIRSDGMHVVKLTQLQGGAVAYLTPAAVTQINLKAAVGFAVNTDFGTGLVTGYRAKDGMFQLALPYGTAYVQAEAIQGFGFQVQTAVSEGCVIN